MNEIITYNQRDASLDAVAGIMILWIIVGHTLDWVDLCDTKFWETILRFFFFWMPWFFFKAGMFYQEKPIRIIVFSSFKRLIVPFCFFGLLSFIIYAIRILATGGSLLSLLKMLVASLFLHGTIPGNSALWFFITLFLVRVSYCFLSRKCSDVVILGLMLILLVINLFLKEHYLPYQEFFSLPDYLYNTLSGLFFFAAGHLLVRLQYKTIVFVLSIILYCIIVLFCFSYVDFFHNRIIEGSYVLWLLLSLCGIIWINYFFKFLDTSGIRLSLLSYLGRNSIVFFGGHFMVGNIVWMTVIHPLHISKVGIQLLLYFCSYLVLLPILNRVLHDVRLRFLIGE